MCPSSSQATLMSARHCGVAAGLAKLSPPILTLQLARAGPGLCPMEITVRERRASCSSLKEQRKMFQGGGRKNLGEKKKTFQRSWRYRRGSSCCMMMVERTQKRRTVGTLCIPGWKKAGTPCWEKENIFGVEEVLVLMVEEHKSHSLGGTGTG